MNYRRRRLSGFTIVELLVVIMVVAILASVLMAIFSSARERSRRTTCASNLRQIGMAALMYAEDADGRFMPVRNETQLPEWRSATWFRLLQPYIKDQKILDCPSDDTGTFKNYDGWATYGYNVHIGGWSDPALRSPGITAINQTQGQIMRPAATVMMTDSGTVAMGATVINGSVNASGPVGEGPAMIPCPTEIGDAAVVNPTPTPGPGMAGYVVTGALPAPRPRHQGKANVLWVDGHVTTAAVSSFYVAPGVTAPGETIPGYSPCMRPEKGCS